MLPTLPASLPSSLHSHIWICFPLQCSGSVREGSCNTHRTRFFPLCMELAAARLFPFSSRGQRNSHEHLLVYIYSDISKRGKAEHPFSPPLLPLLCPLPAGWKVPLDEAELKPTELFPLPVFFPLWLLPWLEDFLPFTSDRPTSEASLLPSWWLVEPWQQQTQRSLTQARCGHSRGSFDQFPLKRSNCPLCPQSDAQAMLLSRKKATFPSLAASHPI